MRKNHTRVRNKLLYMRSCLIDTAHLIIHIIDLTAAPYLTVDCLSYHFIVVLGNKCLNRHPVYRRFLNDAHIPDSYKAHMKRSGDRRCTQRQNVNIFLELFNFFFVRNSKPLLLINYQKPQILIFHIL